MVFVRPAFRGVTQTNNWWCWAACLEILNRLHPDKFPSPPLSQTEWINEMRALPDSSRYLNAEGGINMRILPQVLNILRMTGHQWSGPPANPPDINFIEEKLHISYLLAVYPVPGGSHFVVIRGVDANRIFYFNPYTGIGDTSATYAQVRSRALIIAWK